MGSACCVAAKDRTITNGPSRDNIPRTIRYSPSWSVRRDNRRRVAGEEASINWVSDDLGTNDRLDNKSQTTAGTAYASEADGPPNNQSLSQITSEVSKTDRSDVISETHPASEPSPLMMSSSTHSVSSFSPSPLSSSQPHFIPTSSRWHNRSPVHRLLRQVSDSGWSFDSKSLNRTSGRVSSSPSNDMQTCGICSMLLTEKPSWGTHKIVPIDDLAVVAILICGHVYHSECLENMTSEVNKYDPVCPVCTLGEKTVIKLSEKINKKSRRRVVDGDDVMFDRHKIGPKMSLSSSMKSSLGKPFLKRHLSDNNFPRKKGFFWAKSSKQ